MASTDTEKMDREAKADTPAAEDVLLGKCPRCDKNIEITGAKFQWYVRTFFFRIRNFHPFFFFKNSGECGQMLEYIQEKDTGMNYVREGEDNETKKGGDASDLDHFEKRSALRKIGYNNGCRTVNVVQDHQVEHPNQFRVTAAPYSYQGIGELTTRAHKSSIGRTVGSKANRNGQDGVGGMHRRQR